MTTAAVREAFIQVRHHFASHSAVLRIYIGTIFLSALLLFSVQPVFAKMVLPTLGGSPSVWAVSMCFFQAVLLGGYCYAHALNRFASVRTGAAIHLCVLMLAFLALPFGLPANAEPPAGDAYLWLIGVLGAGVGIPFFAVSANAPLLQAWFARSGHPHAADPYFLYGASNLGSLLALLAYPFVLEPALGLSAQASAWTFGFGLLAVMIAVSAGVVLVIAANAGAHGAMADTGAQRVADVAPLTWTQRAIWVGLSLVPSGLLVAFTTRLTTDIASAPFLWVIPLAAFLATFIVVFREKSMIADETLRHALAPLAAFALFVSGTTPSATLWGGSTVVLSFVAFLVVTLYCHRQLYLLRPASAHLTEFYLWMSFGGVLGGMLASLAAPQLFNTIIEYPLFFVAALACQPGVWQRPDAKEREVLVGLCTAAAVFLLSFAVIAFMNAGVVKLALGLMGALLIAVCFIWRLKEHRTLLACAAALPVIVMIPSGISALSSQRSFFGVVHVAEITDGQHRIMLHGTTLHGAERIKMADGTVPAKPVGATYYHPKSPMAKGLEVARATTATPGQAMNVGVVGLGVGSLACYAQAGEQWRYFEIDPLVVKIASDPKYFSFLSKCPPSRGIVVGDARLTLKSEPRAAFDYLVIDAFSSDAVPVHLMTREAIAMYMERVKPDGLLVMHVSSRFMDLENVASVTAASLGGLHVAVTRTTEAVTSVDTTNSAVVFVSRSEKVLAAVKALPGVRVVETKAITPWSDDYSDIMSAIRRNLIGR